MELGIDRKNELEPLSIRYYQLIMMGHSLSDIESQYEGTHLTLEEKIWIFSTGRARYIGYTELIKKQNQQNARSSLILGSAILIAVTVFLSFAEWPSNGRGSGLLVVAILLGMAALFYGAWEWFNAEMPGKREDVKGYKR